MKNSGNTVLLASIRMIITPIPIRIEQNDVPVYDESGTLVALEGIPRDITERKKLEETVRRSEILFSEVFEILPIGLPIGLWIAEKNGKLMKR